MADFFTLAVPSFIGGMVFLSALVVLLPMANIKLPPFGASWRLMLFILMAYAVTYYTPLLLDRSIDGEDPLGNLRFITLFLCFWAGHATAHYIYTKLTMIKGKDDDEDT